MPDSQHAYKRVRLADLKPYEKNARVHTPKQIEQLRASIREFGFTNPLLIDAEGNLIAGHGRRLAAMAEGYEEGPAIEVVGLTSAQKRALGIADNQLGLNAAWDESLLMGELAVLKAEGFTLDVVGFTDKELKRLLNLTPEKASDDVPEPPKRPSTKVGDLWALGKHRLLCGDSFEPEDVGRLMGKRKADMVLTDPPYAIYGSSTGIAADIADDKMVRPFFEKLGQVIVENLKEFGHAYVHCDWRSYATVWHGLKFARLSPKNCIVWDKGHFGLGGMYGNAHEFVAFFARLPPQKAMTSTDKRGQRSVLGCANVFKCSRVAGPDREHNAAKPVELFAWLIDNSSDKGQCVLDLFAGSGSTLIAAHQQGRIGYAMEMEPRFCDVIVERYQRFAGEEVTLCGGGGTFAAVKEKRSGRAA
jgi:DNA modification methylase